MRKKPIGLVVRAALVLAGVALWMTLAGEVQAKHAGPANARASASNATNVNITNIIGFNGGMRQVGSRTPCGNNNPAPAPNGIPVARDNPGGPGRGMVGQPPVNEPGRGAIGQPPVNGPGRDTVGQPPVNGPGRGMVGQPPVNGPGRGAIGQPPVNGPNNNQQRPPNLQGRGMKPDPGQVGGKLGSNNKNGKGGPASRGPNAGPVGAKVGGKGNPSSNGPGALGGGQAGKGNGNAKAPTLPMIPQMNGNKGGGNRGGMPPALMNQPSMRNNPLLLGGGNAGCQMGNRGGGKAGKK